MHKTTGRWKLGFGLSIITAVFWGILPIALKVLLDGMDPFTITWFRFLLAALVMAVFVYRRHGRIPLRKIRGRVLVLLLIAAVAVCGNYILFLLGLEFLTPSASEIVIQLAPLFLLFGGILFFKEAFHRIQWVGVTVFVLGMILFFNQRLEELFYRMTNYTIGVLLVVAASLAWAIYAIAQKQLLRVFRSETIMLFLYIVGVFSLLMVSQPSQVFQLNRTHLMLLVFCGLNTVIAYGSFAEALDHWEASRVSAVLTTVPLLTVFAMSIGNRLFPEFIAPEHLNVLSIVGASLVVVGSMMTALGRSRENKKIGYQ